MLFNGSVVTPETSHVLMVVNLARSKATVLNKRLTNEELDRLISEGGKPDQ